MDTIENTTPQLPDFGALLEAIKENGRRIDERDARYDKERAEREKERIEREAKWEAERREQDAKWKAERKEQEAKWEAERREQEAKRAAERKEQEAKWEAERRKQEAKRAAERKEWEAEMKASNDRLNKISEDTNRAIKDMKNVFTTQWGRLVEALSKPAALALFKKEGIDIDRVFEEIHKIKNNGQDVMEIDVALCDTSVVVIVEVKTRCGKNDIDYFLRQMEHCKEWYPDFANKTLLVAVAAIQYDSGADKYAQRQGLYVLTLSGEDTFKMSAPANRREF